MVERELKDSKVPRVEWREQNTSEEGSKSIHEELNEKYDTSPPTDENKRHLFDCFYLLSILSCFENQIPDKTILLLRIINLATRNRKIEWA